MMDKSLTQLLVLLFLALGSTLQAVPSFTEPTPPASAPSDAQMCNLPPPAFFSMMSIGPTWITLSWSPVPGAAAYHIITREVATGNIVDNSIVPAPLNGKTINGLSPNTEYESRIWSVCPNGQDGPNYSAARGTTIVIDIVTAGYPAPPPCQVEECELVLDTTMCSFPWNPNAITYFRVRKANGTGPVRHFAIITSGNNEVNLHEDDDTNSDITFEKDEPGLRFVKILCTGYGQIAQIKAQHGTSVGLGLLSRDTNGQNHRDFKIFKLVPCSGQGYQQDNPISWESNPSKIYPATSVIVSPNPFTDQMEVYMGTSDNPEPAMLRLYDTQGREVLAHRVPAGQDRYSLATAALPPSVYFLRIESAGQVQTVRVVKTR